MTNITKKSIGHVTIYILLILLSLLIGIIVFNIDMIVT